MKNILIFVAVIALITLIGNACSDDTVSYYVDKNGNGREDFGEGVWYEDKNGSHFYD